MTHTPETIMDNALMAESTLIVRCRSDAEAKAIRMSCYNRRSAEKRKLARKGLFQEHPWDSLIFKLSRDEQARPIIEISKGLPVSLEFK